MTMNEDSYFYASNGDTLKSKEDMLAFLNKCDEETFLNHVNQEKSDLANWTRDVLKEKRLSKKMIKTIKRNELKQQFILYIII